MKLQNSLEEWLWYSIRRRLLDADLEALRDHMHGRVLEIGSGRRGRRGYFQPPIGRVETWIYLDLESKREPHIRGDVEYLCLKDGVFDTIVCLEVLEHVTHPQVAMKEMHRVLNDGVLILSTPFLHGVHEPLDYWRFTEHGLRYLLTASGFKIRYVKRQGAALSVVVNILKYIIYLMPSGWLRYLLAFTAYLPLMGLFRLDRWIVQRLPVLRKFPAGYLVYAVKS